ncbi:MAG: DUF4474 domain-containing protein [Clostridia bacterium]|nr:DUF4474 domain-containing protein [Clostridia bacterium]
MKMFKKILSFTLAAIMTLTLWMPATALTVKETDTSYSLMGVDDYAQLLYDEGYPVFTTQRFAKIVRTVRKLISLLTGREYQTFNLTMDSFLSEVSAYVCDNSGLDMEMILKNLPDITVPAKLVNQTFNLDTEAFREQMYVKRDEYNANGDVLMGWIHHFLGLYLSIIELCEVYSEQTSDPVVYEVIIRFTFKDGGQEIFCPGIFINTETGECTNRGDNGLIGTGYNYNFADMVLYTTVHSWMREFGFCLLYDAAASSMPVFFNYRTRRFKFDYDGMEWMIQIWKGNYTVANGAEVGLYCRTPEKFGSFYECANDEQMLDMEMQLYHGDELLVNKPLQKHWWINGFNLGHRMYIPESLTMNFSIVMPDEDMLNAFCQSIDNHYMHDVSYTTDGLTVRVEW